MPGSPSKTSLLAVATYLFVLTVCVKGIYLYETQHPARDALLAVQGIIKEVRLGGQGNATVLSVVSESGMHPYLSHFGKVWPGMELIQVGDPVHLLAEREKLNQRELITGKRYYMWELTHRNHLIMRYEDTLEVVREAEATVNRFITLGLEFSFVFLLIAYIRKKRRAGS
jgi:hypothetical protein